MANGYQTYNPQRRDCLQMSSYLFDSKNDTQRLERKTQEIREIALLLAVSLRSLLTACLSWLCTYRLHLDLNRTRMSELLARSTCACCSIAACLLQYVCWSMSVKAASCPRARLLYANSRRHMHTHRHKHTFLHNTHTHTFEHTYIHTYTYMYRERERER